MRGGSSQPWDRPTRKWEQPRRDTISVEAESRDRTRGAGLDIGRLLWGDERRGWKRSSESGFEKFILDVVRVVRVGSRWSLRYDESGEFRHKCVFQRTQDCGLRRRN